MPITTFLNSSGCSSVSYGCLVTSEIFAPVDNGHGVW
jgi:hypothetical protein